MIEWVLSIGVLTGFILFRSFPRLWVQRGKLSLLFHDTWFHLLFAEEVRANRHRIPRRIRGFLLSRQTAYPPLFHWLLSFLPRRLRERTEPFWGGVLDGLTAIALLWVISHALPDGSLRIGWIAVGLFAVTPSMLGVGWGPRALHGTPRVWGQMLFSLSTLCFLIHLSTGSWLWFAVAAGLGSLIFVSSLFSIQAFVFLNLVVALLNWSWEPLALIAAGFGLSLLWFKGRALHVLLRQSRILVSIRRSLRQGRFDGHDIQCRNRWLDLLRLPGYLLRDPRKARLLATRQNTLLILLLQTPLVVACIWLGGPTGGAVSGPVHVAGLYVWAGLILFGFTSLRPLLFLGEAERYVEHVVPLLCLTLAFSIASRPGGLGAAVPFLLMDYSLFAYLYHAVDFIQTGKQSLPRQALVQEALDWIRLHAEGKRFAVLPRNQMNMLIPYFTSGSVLFGQWNSQSPPELLALRNPDSEEFAQHREALFERFQIDYVVAATRTREQPGFQDLFKAYPVVWQNEETSLLACRLSHPETNQD